MFLCPATELHILLFFLSFVHLNLIIYVTLSSSLRFVFWPLNFSASKISLSLFKQICEDVQRDK